MSHTVTITRLPVAEYGDYEYEFGGTCDSTCDVWKPCEKACQSIDPEGVRGAAIIHGVEHYWEWAEQAWVIHDPRLCALNYVFEDAGSVETFHDAEVTLGTYLVHPKWEDGWFLEVGEKIESGTGVDA